MVRPQRRHMKHIVHAVQWSGQLNPEAKVMLPNYLSNWKRTLVPWCKLELQALFPSKMLDVNQDTVIDL